MKRSEGKGGSMGRDREYDEGKCNEAPNNHQA